MKDTPSANNAGPYVFLDRTWSYTPLSIPAFSFCNNQTPKKTWITEPQYTYCYCHILQGTT